MLAVNSYLGGQVVAVLDQLGVPFPGGEPQELRAAAGQWRSMAQCLEGLADDWQARITGLDAYWSGRGADACAGHLTGRVTALRAAAVEFRGLAEGLERHADEAERIAVEIVGLALEIGEQLLLGAALSVVTAGAAGAVAAAAASVQAVRIGALVVRFVASVRRAVAVVRGFRVGAVLTSRAAGAFAESYAVDLAGSTISQAVAGQDVTWGHNARDALVSAGLSTGQRRLEAVQPLLRAASQQDRIGYAATTGALRGATGQLTVAGLEGSSPAAATQDEYLGLGAGLRDAAATALGGSTVVRVAARSVEKSGRSATETALDDGLTADFRPEDRPAGTLAGQSAGPVHSLADGPSLAQP